MAKSENQRMKILILYDTLRVETDENHPLSTNELIEKLNGYDIKCDRKALYCDINYINAFFNKHENKTIIKVIRSRQNLYYFAKKELHQYEIKFILDVLQASAFIPAKQTKELRNKIAALAGLEQASVLVENVLLFDKAKHNNVEVFSSLSEINNAIENKKQLTFKYFNLGYRCLREYHHNGERYVVDCAGLIFNNGYYYLIAYSYRDKGFRTYRIDRMSCCKCSGNDITHNKEIESFKDSNTKDRLNAFNMWSGEDKNVTLLVNVKNLGDIYDKFGEDIYVREYDENHYKVTVNVNLSPVFYGWVASFGTDMKILSPSTVIDEYKELLNKSLSQYVNKEGNKNG